jgi:hypothetical protein
MRHGNIKVQEIQFDDTTVQTTAPRLSQLSISETTVTTSYTLTNSDLQNKCKLLSHGNDNVILYVPSDSDVPCPIGSSIIVSNYGTGDITVTGSPGAVLNTPQSTILSGQYSRAILIKTEPDTWEIDGNIASGQQIFIFPNHAILTTKILDPVDFNPPVNTDMVNHHIKIESGSYIFSTDTVLNRVSGIWRGPTYTGDSRIFTNSTVDGLYLRAVSLTPSIVFLTTPEHVGDTKTYRAEGEWSLFTMPNSGNGYADNNTNPQWRIEQQYDSQISFDLRIDVSTTNSDSGIIGSFYPTFNPLQFDNFIFHQSFTVDTDFIYLDTVGNLYKTNTQDTNSGDIFGSITLHPEYNNQIDPEGIYGIYFRVVGGSTNQVSNGVMGTIYNFQYSTLYNLIFEKPDVPGIRTIEILTDTTGTLEVYATIDIDFTG